MGQLADRLAFLTRRYGSDAAAWQHEIHAVGSLELADPKAALERFHEIKRRLAEFRRSQLLTELKAYPFVTDLPPLEARGYPLIEIESDIRDATRALTHARAIATGLLAQAEARASLRLRQLAAPETLPHARWDELRPLAEATEAQRRIAAREARLDARLSDATRRARKLARTDIPDASADADALDAALDAHEAVLTRTESLNEALRSALEPLKAPEVATYRGETRRALERDARALHARGDRAALLAMRPRSEALRAEAAALASQAARSRRKGLAAPERERRSSDTMDGYG